MRIIKLSRKAILILSCISALIISTLCGTQQLFSLYSTSITDKLGFTSVQINTIGISENYGFSLLTPVFGYIVDDYPSRL